MLLLFVLSISFVALYPFPTLDELSKEWPIQTLEEYHNKIGSMLKENGVTMNFPPKLASFVKISLSNGITLNALEGGRNEQDPNQKLLIFMHGYPESALLCYGRYLDHYIQQGYWVIAADMRGYNQSSKPVPEGVDLDQISNGLASDWSFESVWKYLKDLNSVANEYIDVKLAKDYQLLVTEYANRENAVFISHDWGSGVLVYVLRIYPEIVEKAVIGVAMSIRANEFKYITEHTYAYLLQLAKSWYIFLLQFPGLSDFLFKQNNFAFFLNFVSFHQEGLKGRLSAEESRIWLQNFKTSFTTASSFYRGALRSQTKHSFDSNKIDLPVMFMHGEKDRYLVVDTMHFSMEHAMTERARQKSKVVLVEESSHWIQLYGEKFVKQLDEFIRED